MPKMTHIAKFGHQAPESNISSGMLGHWVKVIWAKNGGSGTPSGPTIICSSTETTETINTHLDLKVHEDIEIYNDREFSGTGTIFFWYQDRYFP